jgi:hypothetical protein
MVFENFSLSPKKLQIGYGQSQTTNDMPPSSLMDSNVNLN